MSHRTLRIALCLAFAALGVAGGGCSRPAAVPPSPLPSAAAHQAMLQDMHAPTASPKPAAPAPGTP